MCACTWLASNGYTVLMAVSQQPSLIHIHELCRLGNVGMIEDMRFRVTEELRPAHKRPRLCGYTLGSYVVVGPSCTTTHAISWWYTTFLSAVTACGTLDLWCESSLGRSPMGTRRPTRALPYQEAGGEPMFSHHRIWAFCRRSRGGMVCNHWASAAVETLLGSASDGREGGGSGWLLLANTSPNEKER